MKRRPKTRPICSHRSATRHKNIKGDIAGALKELHSKENAKGLAVAMLTAGAVQGLGAEFGLVSGGKATLLQNLQTNLVNGVASSLISTAINGGSLEDALKNAVKNAVISAVASQGANAIGDLKLDIFSSNLAHAILGCAVGSATAGSSSGCAAGAGGAVVGHLSAQWYDTNIAGASAADIANFAKLTTALTSLVGGANAMNIAGVTSSNAVANNYLDHRKPSLMELSEKERYDRAVEECAGGSGSAQACNRQTELANRSKSRDIALANACGVTGTIESCNALAKEAYAMGNNVFGNYGGLVFANSPDTGLGLNVSTIGATPVNPASANSWHNQLAQSTSEGLIVLPSGMAGATRVPAGLLRAEITAVNAASVASAHATVIVQAVRAGVQTEAQLWVFVANTYGAPAATAMMAASANPQNVQRMINATDFLSSAFNLDGTPPTNLSSLFGALANFYYTNKK